jgi:hypothetical protein
MAETDSHIDAYMKLIDDIPGILRLSNKLPDPCAMITVSFTPSCSYKTLNVSHTRGSPSEHLHVIARHFVKNE